MPANTLRRIKLARNIVDGFNSNRPINNIGAELVKVGYAKTTAYAKQKEILQSKDVQDELKRLGFDEYTAKSVVAEILTDRRVKPDSRLNAADKVFKVFGSYAPEKSISLSVSATAQLSDEELEKIAYGADKPENEALQAP